MRRARPLLGTIVEITADGAADILPAAIEAAFASIAQVERLMSFHDPDSDVSRINGAAPGQEVGIDPHTVCVLRFARQVSDVSEGLFDVTTAAVLVASGFLPRREKETVPAGTSYHDLDLLPGDRAVWRRKGWVDLGGIAKGYAVDCAITALRSCDVASAVVNAGGDLRCFGKPQPVHVRDPGAPTMLMDLGWLDDAALATSAGYFSGIDDGGGKIDPLVDPRQMNCDRWNGSVSVAAPDAITADALTKVVRLASDTVPDILGRFGAQAIVIDHEGGRSCGWRLLQQECET